MPAEDQTLVDLLEEASRDSETGLRLLDRHEDAEFYPFSDVWRRVIWANPELNYQLRNPVNNAAIQVRDVERTQKERASMKEIAREWGVFFVFRSDCPYCHPPNARRQWRGYWGSPPRVGNPGRYRVPAPPPAGTGAGSGCPPENRNLVG